MFDYTARPDLLAGRIIMVTGAGRGIGEAAAKAYAAHGATVLLLGKNEDNLNRVYDDIEAAGHPRPAVIPFNLETALPHQYDELAAMIEREFGRLDGLLHNAAIVGPRTPLEQLSGDNFMACDAGECERDVHAHQYAAAAAQAVGRCIGHLHLQQRRS